MTRTFVPTRRRLLAGLAAAAVFPSRPGAQAAWPGAKALSGLLLSALDDLKGGHYFAAFDLATGERFAIEVPDRGHQVIPKPGSRQALMFPRRPGKVAWVVDLRDKAIVHAIQSLPGRHFHGHGCFSPDGALLYTTQNDYARGRGMIGVWDSATFASLGEFPSYGLGPHDIRVMPGASTLVIANGGIRTHPDLSRRKLNLDTMQPSLAYVDPHSAELRERLTLADHHLSIRHLDVTEAGLVGVALQDEAPGRSSRAAPLVAVHRPGKALQPLAAPKSVLAPMRGYAAAIRIHQPSGIAAVMAPRGALVTFWDLRRAGHSRSLSIPDAAGVALTRDGSEFVVSNGDGELRLISSTTLEPWHSPAWRWPRHRWDNHLSLLD